MEVYEKIKEMSDRIVQGESQTTAKKIKLYSAGVQAKLRNAEYALYKISDLSPQSNDVTSTDEGSFLITDKIHFYVDSFFAFLYSAFDVMSQVINQKMNIGTDELDVSFGKLKRILDSNYVGNPIQQLFNEISKKNFFKNLMRYRNCSTHRRQIYIKAVTSIISETPGYTSTERVTTVKRVLCDNPLSLKPKINQDRELISYCVNIFERAHKEIRRISEAL